MIEIEMGYRGSKSDLSVKEQRVDGFSITYCSCKVYSGHRETGSWKKTKSNSRLKIPYKQFINIYIFI